MADEAEQTQDSGEAEGQTETNAGGEASAAKPEAEVGKTPSVSAGEEGGEHGREAGASSSSSTEADGEAGAGGKEPWFMKRIGKQSAQIAELKQQLEDKTRAQTTQGRNETDAAYEARVQAEVTRRVSKAEAEGKQAAFTTALNSQVSEGEKTFGKDAFTKSAVALGRLYDSTNPAESERYLGFLQTMLDTGELPKLVHVLGQDLDEAERIMGMTPGKQGVALAKLAAKDIGEVSKTPKPGRAIVGSRGAPLADLDPDDPEQAAKLSTDEWVKRREAKLKAGREARA